MSRALVVGLARSGRAAAALLAREGWDVVAADAAAVAAPELAELGVDVRAPDESPVADVELVVKSPGVPGDAPQVIAARRAGVAVISELELAARFLENPMIAITGTNGKTTTTELTAHLLRAAGIPAVACGNQGTPACGLVGAIDPTSWLVVECSSFQLEDVADTFHPRVAIVLNVTPDHLDRHGDMAAYTAAKLRIFERLKPRDLAIAPPATVIPGGALMHTVEVGPQTRTAVAWGEGGVHHLDLGSVTGWDRVALRGAHNRQNALAAVAAAAHAGAGAEAIARGLATFPGVPHRLEVVAAIDGVEYVNDSKATNPDAAMAALDAYPQRVHLIAGGRGKGTSFAPLAARAAGAVVSAHLIGEAASEIGEEFVRVGIPVSTAGDMATAVANAHESARPGDVVLLAPACTSFDQYPDFEARGAHFREIVAGLDD